MGQRETDEGMGPYADPTPGKEPPQVEAIPSGTESAPPGTNEAATAPDSGGPSAGRAKGVDDETDPDSSRKTPAGQPAPPEPAASTDREPEGDAGPSSDTPPEGSTATPPANEVANAVAGRLDGIEARMEKGLGRVLEVFNDKIRYDAAKEKQFDQMHQELQRYRSDLVERTSRPLVHGMIVLHGDIGRLVSDWRRKGENLPLEKWLARFEELREDIEILLDDHGVTAYPQSRGRLFDGKSQKSRGRLFDGKSQTIVATVATDDNVQHGVVAESRRPGFMRGGRILVKERVAVFKVRAPAEPPDGEPQASSDGAAQTTKEED